MSGVALFGGGAALILVPAYSDLLKQAQWVYYSRFKRSTLRVTTYFHRKWDQDKQNSALNSTVSGLKTLSLAIG